MANIPVETPNAPAAAAMRDFLGLVPAQDLSDAAALDGTEYVAIVQADSDFRTTLQDIADLATGGGAADPVIAPTSVTYFTELLGNGSDGGFLVSFPWYTQGNVVNGANQIDIGVDAAAASRGTRRLRTSTSSSARSSIVSYKDSAYLTLDAITLELEYRIRLVQAPTSGEDFEFFFGLGQSTFSQVPDNMFDLAMFRYRWDGSAAVFLSSTRSGAGTIQDTTLTTPTLSTFFSAKVIIPTSGNVTFHLDTGSGYSQVASHSTKPRNNVNTLAHGVGMAKVAGTTEVYGDVDAMLAKYSGLR